MLAQVGDRVKVVLNPSGESCHGEVVSTSNRGEYWVKLDKEYNHFDDDDTVICHADELHTPDH